jgi:hypothetical protein
MCNFYLIFKNIQKLNITPETVLATLNKNKQKMYFHHSITKALIRGVASSCRLVKCTMKVNMQNQKTDDLEH